MKIKSGQLVKILSGKDKGKTGKVIQVFPDLNKVVVEGVNKAFKHLKRRNATGAEKGERVDFFAPLHVSNVRLTEATGSSSATETARKKGVKKS